MTSISDLIKFISKNFKFDAKTHPELEGKSEKEILLFATKHLALHASKTAGKMATVSERADHDEKLNIAQLKEDIPKSLISTLKLAELVGMSEKEIVTAIEEKYDDKLE